MDKSAKSGKSPASRKGALSDDQLESVVGGSGRRPSKKPMKIVKAKKRH